MVRKSQKAWYFSTFIIGFLITLIIINVLTWFFLWYCDEYVDKLLLSVRSRTYCLLIFELVALSVAIHFTLTFILLPSALQNCRASVILARLMVFAGPATPIILCGFQEIAFKIGENTAKITWQDAGIASVITLFITYLGLAYFNWRYDTLVNTNWATKIPGL